MVKRNVAKVPAGVHGRDNFSGQRFERFANRPNEVVTSLEAPPGPAPASGPPGLYEQVRCFTLQAEGVTPV
jgi:hypothetical protein